MRPKRYFSLMERRNRLLLSSHDMAGKVCKNGREGRKWKGTEMGTMAADGAPRVFGCVRGRVLED